MRDTMNTRRVTSVVAEVKPNVAGAVQGVMEQSFKASTEARIKKNTSQMQVELNKIANQVKVDYQSDPVAGQDFFKKERARLAKEFGNDIPPMYKNDWLANVQGIETKTDMFMDDWSFNQNQANTAQFINDGITSNLELAMADGQMFADTGMDINSALNFETSFGDLKEFGDKNLGEMKTQELLKSYKSDYAKSFVGGVMSTNPERAMEMLDSDVVKNAITSPADIEELKSMAFKKSKEMTLTQMQGQEETQSTLMTELLSGDYDPLEMTNRISKLDIANNITDKFATEARQLIKSEKALNPVTDNETLASLLLQLSSINKNKDLSGEDYLNQRMDLQKLAIGAHSSGRLSKTDLARFDKEMNSKDSKKNFVQSIEGISDNTTWFGYDYGDAYKDMVNELPNEPMAKMALERYFNEVSQQEDLTRSEKKVIRAKIQRDVKAEFFSKMFASPEQVENAIESGEIKSGDIIYVDGKKAKVD